MSYPIPTLDAPIHVRDASPAIMRWVENQLAIGEFLPQCQNNGLFGQATLDALEVFKDQFQLEYPHGLGNTTLEALAKLEAPHPISEQNPQPELKADPQAGSKSGKQITLPVVGAVHLNEWILPNSFLTYAEFTHGGSRVPTTQQQVKNMLEIAERFGQVRRKFGTAIGVTSGFRPEHINQRVGGARNSWHVRAGALDIYPINGNMAALTEVLKNSNVGGIGIARSFRHIDLGARRFWRYGR